MDARKRLYVSDLDGTLLDRGANLSERTRDGVLRLLDAGVEFTVASARSLFSMRHMFEGVPLRLPIVEFHGAYVSHLDTGEHLVVNALGTDVAAGVLDLVQDARLPVFLSTFDGVADRLYHSGPGNGASEWYLEDRRRYRDPRLETVRDAADHVGDQVVCATAMGRREQVVPLAAAIQGRFGDEVSVHDFPNAYSPGWHWVTTLASTATKARGIATLRELEGLLEHELVVFGDTAGDAAMFRAADRAVAVGNAEPALLELATDRIGHHTDDSVIRYLLEESGLG